MSGVVYQCYCPEKNYSDNELYNHLRNKVTQDIGKLIDADNAEKLKALGVHYIKEWHFVIPEYKDKRIIEHLETKRKEILDAKKSNPTIFSYIDNDIKLILKIAEDFKVEFVRLIRNPLVDIKLNATVKSIKVTDWSSCDTDKINNIKRKIKAIMGPDENEEYSDMIKFWAEAYLKGIEIMNSLQSSCGTIYEELFELEQQYKNKVSVKSKMNRDSSLNYTIFMGVLEDFEDILLKEFTCFSRSTIMELKTDIISSWLADCSLQFKVGV